VLSGLLICVSCRASTCTLRFEIAQLKEEKLQKIESKTKTFATAVLQIKPKNKGEEVKKN
jgi:hypothetical protein